MSAIFLRRQSSTPGFQRSESKRRPVSGVTVVEEAEEQEPFLAFDFDHAGEKARGTLPSIQISIPAEDEKPDSTDQGCWHRTKRYFDFFDKWGLKKLAPILLLIIYSLAGAGMFFYIEHEAYTKQGNELASFLDFLLDYTSANITQYVVDSLPGVSSAQAELLYTYCRGQMVEYETTLGVRTETLISWKNMWGALYYVGTVYTTIGYGNIAPTTTTGQALTIFYSIVGIPLVLAILNNLGKFLTKWIKLFWKCLCQISQKVRALRSNSMRFVQRKISSISGQRRISLAEDLNSIYEFNEEPVPVTLAIFILVSYMCLCAGIFCIWEDWKYWTSFYFFFISLSTIGFGDISPTHPKLMILSFPLVIIGLALFSMLINVIQQKIEDWLYQMMKMIQEEYDRAMEMGEGPERDAILAKVMKKQPWLLRNLMPTLMGESQMVKLEEQFEKHSNRSYNTKCTQTTKEEPNETPKKEIPKAKAASKNFLDVNPDDYERPTPKAVTTPLQSAPAVLEPAEVISKPIINTVDIGTQMFTAMRYIMTQTKHPNLEDLDMQTSLIATEDEDIQTSVFAEIDESLQTSLVLGEDECMQTSVVQRDDATMQTSVSLDDNEVIPDSPLMPQVYQNAALQTDFIQFEENPIKYTPVPLCDATLQTLLITCDDICIQTSVILGDDECLQTSPPPIANVFSQVSFDMSPAVETASVLTQTPVAYAPVSSDVSMQTSFINDRISPATVSQTFTQTPRIFNKESAAQINLDRKVLTDIPTQTPSIHRKQFGNQTSVCEMENMTTQTSPAISLEFGNQTSIVLSEDSAMQTSPLHMKNFTYQSSVIIAQEVDTQTTATETLDFAAQTVFPEEKLLPFDFGLQVSLEKILVDDATQTVKRKHVHFSTEKRDMQTSPIEFEKISFDASQHVSTQTAPHPVQRQLSVQETIGHEFEDVSIQTSPILTKNFGDQTFLENVPLCVDARTSPVFEHEPSITAKKEAAITQTETVSVRNFGLQTSLDHEPMPHSPSTQNKIVQTDKFKQNMVTCSVQTLPTTGSDQNMQSKKLIERKEAISQTDAENLSVTLPIIKPAAKPKKTRENMTQTDALKPKGRSIEIQTNDSYLKIAKKLEALRLHRTKSLAVMKVPKLKPVIKDQPHPETLHENGNETED